MKVRDYYTTPKSTAVMRFLWQAAGGDRYILERATYSDQIKYMCLGGIVFATGAMAGLAGGYAFYTIFSPKTSNVLDKTKTLVADASYIPTDIPTVILSVLFGIIWGLIIFNIDRFIVTSTGKGDGTEAITWGEFKGAIPRIIMGAIIAITISKPIEIRMFKAEIDRAVSKQQEIEKEKVINQADVLFEKEVSLAKARSGKIGADIDNKKQRYQMLEQKYIVEVVEYPGPRAMALKSEMDALKGEIDRLQSSPEYVETLSTIKQAEAKRKANITQAEQNVASLDGLLIRIQEAEKISGPVISLFITLLFLAIELTPVFFKLMLTKTPYDYLAENRDELIKAENGIEVRYDYYKDKEGQERHLIINHEAERMIHEKMKVTEIQKELTEYAIEKYKQREKGKIDANLDDYIKNINVDEEKAS